MEQIWRGQLGSEEQQTEVWLEIYRLGPDYLAVLGGGLVHLGAFAWAGPLAGGTQSLGIHKEGPIAEELAQILCQGQPGQWMVLAGIHYDHIRPEAIQKILEAARQLGQAFIRDFPTRS